MKEKDLLLNIRADSLITHRHLKSEDIIDYLIEYFNSIEQEDLYHLFDISELNFYNNYFIENNNSGEKIVIDTSKYTDIKYTLENNNIAYLQCSTTMLSKFNKKELFNHGKIVTKKSLFDTSVSIIVTKYLAKISAHFINTYGVKFADITHVAAIDNKYTVAIRSHNLKNERKSGSYHYQEYLSYPTLAEMIKYIDVEHLIGYFYQLLYLLNMMQEKYIFTHNNCSCHNIYVKDLPYMSVNEYHVNKKYYNILSNKIIILTNYKDVTMTINNKLLYEYNRTFNYFEDILYFLQSVSMEAKKYNRKDILEFITTAVQYFDENVNLEEDLRFLTEKREDSDLLDYLDYFNNLYPIDNYNITVHTKKTTLNISTFFNKIYNLIREHIQQDVDVNIPENQILLIENLQKYYTFEEIAEMDIYKVFYYDRYDKAIKFINKIAILKYKDDLMKLRYTKINELAYKIYINSLTTFSLKNFNYILTYFDQYYYIKNSKYDIYRDNSQDKIINNVYKFITAWESLFNIKIKTYNDLRDLYSSLNLTGVNNIKTMNKYKQFLYFKEYCML